MQVENVTSKDAGRVTFPEIAQRWLASVRHTLKPSTVTRRETCIANLEPFFRTVVLSGVKPEHCEQWKNKRGDKIAPQTFAHELGTMKLIFEYAIEHGILYRNPARSIQRRRIIATRKKHIPTRDQFTKLIATVRESDGRKDSQAAAKNGADFVELLAYSGMRKAEAAALKWKDVNFDKNQLTVTGGESGTKNSETRTQCRFQSKQETCARQPNRFVDQCEVLVSRSSRLNHRQ
jgi:integrase